MTELEKIQYTKLFIDKLANGINPLNDEHIPENDLLNNVRISRCMFFVSAILDKVCTELNTPVQKNKIRNSDKKPFFINDKQIQNYEYEESGAYISNIIDKLNAMIDINLMQKIKRNIIVDWLIAENYLYVFEAPNGRTYKKPTQKGIELGIEEEMRTNSNGDYWVVIYNKNAQQFIVENVNEIAKIEFSIEKPQFQGQVWSVEQDKRLEEMFNDGLVTSEIAKELKRTPTSIRARLVKLGLINSRNNVK